MVRASDSTSAAADRGAMVASASRPARLLPLMYSNVVNLHDAVVLQSGDRFGFAAKAVQSFGVGMDPGENHLQRHRPLQLAVLGQVDHTHSATADLTNDLITGNGGWAGAGGFVADEIAAERRDDRRVEDKGRNGFGS